MFLSLNLNFLLNKVFNHYNYVFLKCAQNITIEKSIMTTAERIINSSNLIDCLYNFIPFNHWNFQLVFFKEYFLFLLRKKFPGVLRKNRLDKMCFLKRINQQMKPTIQDVPVFKTVGFPI